MSNPDYARPECAGKGMEHHQQIVIVGGLGYYGRDPGIWSCPDCGDTGDCADFEAYTKRMLPLVPLLYRLRAEMLDRDAVILMPTEAGTGELGKFMGMDIIRVRGLTEPMIGVRPPRLPGPVNDSGAATDG
jgi:hypothetical protein